MSYMFAAGAVISVVSSVATNNRISSQAKSQKKANDAYAERNRNIGNTNLLLQGEDVNKEAGLAYTQATKEATAAAGSAITMVAENMAFGNTAGKIDNNIAINEALSYDNVMQAAESNMMDIQTELTNTAYGFEAKSVQINNDYSQAMNTRKTTLEIAGSAAKSGASAYSFGKSI